MDDEEEVAEWDGDKEKDPEILDEAHDGDNVITEPEYKPLTPSDWDSEDFPRDMIYLFIIIILMMLLS